MKNRFFTFLVFIVIIFMGCARNVTPPQEAVVPVFPEPKVEEQAPVGSGATLPSSHAPLDQNDIAVRRVREVFRSVAPPRALEQFSASQLQAMTERLNVSPVVVAGCDLEVLKVFVASDWLPVVIIRSPVGPKHIRAIVGYDDQFERLSLIDPVNYAEANLAYPEFTKQWDDPQNACLLIFQQRVIEETIKSELTRYLPEEKAKSVSIRMPRKR